MLRFFPLPFYPVFLDGDLDLCVSMNNPMCRQRINYCDSEDLERVKFIIIKQNIQIPPREIRLTYDKTKLCIVSFTCTILGALFYLWDNIYMTDDCINNE